MLSPSSSERWTAEEVEPVGRAAGGEPSSLSLVRSSTLHVVVPIEAVSACREVASREDDEAGRGTRCRLGAVRGGRAQCCAVSTGLVAAGRAAKAPSARWWTRLEGGGRGKDERVGPRRARGGLSAGKTGGARAQGSSTSRSRRNEQSKASKEGDEARAAAALTPRRCSRACETEMQLHVNWAGPPSPRATRPVPADHLACERSRERQEAPRGCQSASGEAGRRRTWGLRFLPCFLPHCPDTLPPRGSSPVSTRPNAT